MTIDQAATTYSFINDFKARAELASYGDNALPLYAVALYLDIEDMASFAANALTDHPSDKKADIIYVNEADGFALIAQGYTAQSWGNPSAPANKASDLNTAAAWLLQMDISAVPPKIKPQAEMLRKCVQDQTIKKIIFAYAHNASISPTVDAELAALTQMVNGLSSYSEVTFEAVELGLNRIQELYLNSTGIIQVTDEIEIPAEDALVVNGPDWDSFVLKLNGETLRQLYETHKDALFSANLRDFLGLRNNSRNVNNTIRDTAQQRPSEFFILNNGVTLITNDAELIPNPQRLKVSGLSVVNGAQTTGALFAAGALHAANVTVLARVIKVSNDALVPKIVAGNNTQNSIVAWDRRSNDAVQLRIESDFSSQGITYVHRRDAVRHSSNSVFAEQIGQMLCAFGGDLQTAIRAKAEIFESDITYSKVFPSTITIQHIYAVQSLGWAYDIVKADLKKRIDSGNATALEASQFALLDFPASKQFIISVLSNLREEIAGRQLSVRAALRFRHDRVIADPTPAKDVWRTVLNFLLPLIASNLSAPPYEAVRSTAHLAAVSTTVKGLVAGFLAIQNPFVGIREFLAPS